MCATLTVSADTEDSITVTLATSDGSGTLIIIVILKNLYEKRLLILFLYLWQSQVVNEHYSTVARWANSIS